MRLDPTVVEVAHSPTAQQGDCDCQGNVAGDVQPTKPSGKGLNSRMIERSCTASFGHRCESQLSPAAGSQEGMPAELQALALAFFVLKISLTDAWRGGGGGAEVSGALRRSSAACTEQELYCACMRCLVALGRDTGVSLEDIRSNVQPGAIRSCLALPHILSAHDNKLEVVSGCRAA